MTNSTPYIPPPAALPPLRLAEGVKESDVDADIVVEKWLTTLQGFFDREDFSNLPSLFLEDCWWRDQVFLSWDTRTMHGLGATTKYLSSAREADHGLSQIQTIKPGALQPTLVNNGIIWIQAGFSFESKYGTGQGIVHLVNVAKDEWKAWIVLTQLQALHHQIKSNGTATTDPDRTRARLLNGDAVSTSPANGDNSPHPDYQVIIIGSGQSGLALAAHLKDKGISYLIVDREERVGNSWRARYETVTSHTPNYTDVYPFMNFPNSYPKWLNQSAISAFQEGYASDMGLNLRLSTHIKNVSFDDATRSYTLHVQPSTQYSTAGGTHSPSSKLTSRHIVLATGMFSTQPIMPEFPSTQKFRGQIYHAKYHRSAASIPDVTNKRVVIIGAGTSSHDIAEDFAAHNARSVTMIQRGATIAVSRSAMERHMLAMWDPDSPVGKHMKMEEADLISHSFPFPVLRTMNVGQTMQMCAEDKETLDALASKGMKLKRGETGEGLADHQFIKGGHFYIDQGAWKHIVEERIKVVHDERGVADIDDQGVHLASDGRLIEADVVVLATGYERCTTFLRDLLGQDVLDKVGDVGGFDEEAERIGWWRPMKAQKGLWYMTGSFLWVRQFSALLALQIAAIERGVNKDYWN